MKKRLIILASIVVVLSIVVPSYFLCREITISNSYEKKIVLKTIENKQLRDTLVQLRPNDVGLPKNMDNILLTVDYSKTAGELISVGNYDDVEYDFAIRMFSWKTKPFKKDVFAKLFHFDISINNAEIIKKMKSEGYRPGRFEELLTLGAKYPSSYEDAICAIGSISYSTDPEYKYFPTIRCQKEGNHRRLGASSAEMKSIKTWHYLGVKDIN